MSARIKSASTPPERRAALRQAHSQRDEAKAVCENARKTELAVRQALLAASKRLDDLGNVDATILEHRSTQVMLAARGGPVPDLRLPEKLEKQRNERDAAREVAAASKRAHDGALAELAAAEKSLQRTELVVANAAADVLLAERASKLGAELQSAWDTVWRLTDTLDGYGAVWVASEYGPRPVAIPRDAVGILSRVKAFDYRQHPGGRNARLAEFREQWTAWHRRLLVNVDAEIESLTDDVVEQVA